MSDGESTPPQQNGNGATALAKLLAQLNVPTLLIILLTGGGNILATKTTSNATRAEVERIIRQIDVIEHTQKELISNQEQMLRNDTKLLSNQMEVLQDLKSKKP